jgi:uncharacterized protein (TIGR03083 family)
VGSLWPTAEQVRRLGAVRVDREEVVAAFLDAAAWIEQLVAPLRPAQLDGPGLGEWSLRQLAAHATRALITVTEYLRTDPTEGLVVADDEDPLAAAGRYFQQTMHNPQLHKEVAERGRQDADRLGDAVTEAPSAALRQVTPMVRQAPAGAIFEGRFGTVGFTTYLCTRTVELVVHGTDICTALGTQAQIPPAAARLALAVMVEGARARGEASAVVVALAGRRPLPADFGVFS